MSTSRVQIPVSVIMQRVARVQGPWSYAQWSAVGAVASNPVEEPSSRRSIWRGEDAEQFLWSGLRLALHPDAAESYWYNLVGRQPSLFVICRGGADGELTPSSVTADYDEAGAHLEADDTVFSVPIPADIHRRLEEYVMAHYRPQAPRKRQRTDWSEGRADGY